jgi:hypothetical protein
MIIFLQYINMETVSRCQAIAKTTGKQCNLRPLKGTKYCKAHTKEIVGVKAPKKTKATTKKTGKELPKKPAKKTAGVASINFERFEALPKMVQIEILLNLDRKTLKNACQMNKEIAEICRQPEFKRRYMERNHPEGDLFYGKIKLLDVKHNRVFPYHHFYTITLVDEKENMIEVTLISSGLRFSNLSKIIYRNKKHNKLIVGRYDKGIPFASVYNRKEAKISAKEEKAFLKSIQRVDWEDGKHAAMELLREVKAATKSKLPWDDDIVLSGYNIHIQKIKMPKERKVERAKVRSTKKR